MQNEITTLLSEDNIEYRIRQTPCECSFAGVGEITTTTDQNGFEFAHVDVSANRLQDICLPLDANPREPTAADVVKKMTETLRTSPERFHHRNNGITVILSLIHI